MKYCLFLKGLFPEIFYLFKKKTVNGSHMNRQKRFREIVHFREDICENRVFA